METESLCCGCLSIGRKMMRLGRGEKLQCFTQIIGEITLSKAEQPQVHLCWECYARLKNFAKFTEKVKRSYNLFSEYLKQNKPKSFLHFSPPNLTTHELYTIDIQLTEKKEAPLIEVIKTENQRQLTPEPEIKEEYDTAIPETNSDDEKLIDISKKIAKVKKKKRKRKEEVFKEVELSREELEEERRAALLAEDYVNAMFQCERCIVSFPNAEDLSDHVRLKHELDLNEYLFTDVSRPPLLTIHKTEPVNITPTDSECQGPASVNVKDELGDHSDCSKEDSIDHSKDNWLSDTIDNDDTIDHVKDEELAIETKLQTIICSIDKGSKKSNGDVKSKVKRSNKIVKRLKGKTSKRQKEDSKVVTIDLSYEEMMEEREMESKRDSYMRAEYKCETCLIGFNYKKSYQTHVNSKHSMSLGEYICPICKTIISSVDSFTAHYKRHMRRYECIICQKRTADLKVMQQHYFATHKISLKEYKCNICGKISSSIDTHRYHKDTHKSRVQCTECDKTFRHRAGLMNHRLAVHELRNAYPCTVCDKVFKWKTSLKRHLEKHGSKSISASAPYCSTCSISFASLCSYQRHLKNSLKHVTQDQLKFICDHCNRRFSDKTKLRDHIEEKHLFKTFTCHICSKPSKNRVGLDQHIRNVHKGRPKNKMCHHCGRGFPTKIQLESHIRTHTGERPFICEFCPTTFSQQSNLYKHNRQVHMNIKSKRYPICKKNKDVTEQIVKVTEHQENVIEDTYRPIVLQYSPERGFVL